eukprot:scpid55018/ scgid0646/ 
MLREIFPNRCPRFIYYGAVAILLALVLLVIQRNNYFIHNGSGRYSITGAVAQLRQGDHGDKPRAVARKNVARAGQGPRGGGGQAAISSSSRSVTSRTTSDRPRGDPMKGLTLQFDPSVWGKASDMIKFSIGAENKLTIEKRKDLGSSSRPTPKVNSSMLPDVHLSPSVVQSIKKFLFFIGYPRSTHTLVGTFLDAHPHVVVSNEYDMTAQFSQDAAMTRQTFFSKLYAQSRVDAERGVRHKLNSTVFRSDCNKTFSYHVPGQWQGRFQDTIQVIGDKKGGGTTKFTARSRQRVVFRNLLQMVALPIYIVHVIRNPFDNISTMLLRTLKARRTATKTSPINNAKGLRGEILKYFQLAHLNVKFHEDKRLFPNILDIHAKKLKKMPRKVLLELCRFLELECSENWLKACTAFVRPSTSRTRDLVVWPEDLKRMVRAEMENIPFLRGNYTFESD